MKLLDANIGVCWNTFSQTILNSKLEDMIMLIKPVRDYLMQIVHLVPDKPEFEGRVNKDLLLIEIDR